MKFIFPPSWKFSDCLQWLLRRGIDWTSLLWISEFPGPYLLHWEAEGDPKLKDDFYDWEDKMDWIEPKKGYGPNV